jgi:ATP-dependent Lon protease
MEETKEQNTPMSNQIDKIDSAVNRNAEKLPKNLYILPLRNGVLFPGVLSPLTVTNERDMEIVKAAEPRGEIGLILLKEELPTPSAGNFEITPEQENHMDEFFRKFGDKSYDEMQELMNKASFSGECVDDSNIAEAKELLRMFSDMIGPEAQSDEKSFYKIGVYARILKKINLPNGGVSLFLTIIRRFQVRRFFSTRNQFIASVDFFEEELQPSIPTTHLTAYTRLLNKEIKTISAISPVFSDEVKVNIANIDNPGRLADYIANNLDITAEEQQSILETIDVQDRVEKVMSFLHKEKTLIKLQYDIENKVKRTVDKRQREFFLTEEMKLIQAELNGTPFDGDIGSVAMKGSSRMDKLSRLKKRAKEAPLNAEAKEAIDSELDKLQQMDPMAHEYGMVLSYIETVLSLPWEEPKHENITIEKAKEILDKDHYGLKDVKERILEFIAVRKLKNDTKGSIICLEGPPGVGKTSIGLSIARALHKKCFRFSVGGVRDEAEIKGHRRTYLGALPGKIIQGLKITKTKDPVFLIDEIDKLQTESNQGNPAAALLEVLDPEQNVSFRDHYLDVPFDVSQVLFIVTANDKSLIPKPLLDRMEVIELSGYTSMEKLEIAKNYLVPKTRKANGLKASDVKISDEMLSYIAEGWAREPGVRNLEKALNRIFRKIALQSFDTQNFKKPVRITESNVVSYLDSPIYSEDDIIRADKPGMSIGLAYNGLGGTTLGIEAISIPGGKGELKLTGQLGDVMKESATIAFSLLRSEAQEHGLDPAWFDTHNVHIHFPDGATPKDGPSAGAAICCAIYSLVSGKMIARDLAMTGELSLTGRVMEIGGLKEKTLAVARNKFKYVIIPRTNKKDVMKLDDCVKNGLTFFTVNDIHQVLKIAFTDDRLPGKADGTEVLSFVGCEK